MDLSQLLHTLSTLVAAASETTARQSEFLTVSNAQGNLDPRTGRIRSSDEMERVVRATPSDAAMVYFLNQVGNAIVDFDKVLSLACARITALGNSCMSEFDAKRFLAAMVLLRSVVEHSVVLAGANLEIAKKLGANSDDPAVYLKGVEEALSVVGFGTRLNWVFLAGVTDLKAVGRKEAAYAPDENGLTLTAQVMNSLDRVEGGTRGLRLAYEILSEFVHPNIGTSHLVTDSIEQFTDKYGIVWLHLVVSTGASTPELRSFHPAFDLALAKVEEFLRTVPAAMETYNSHRPAVLAAVQRVIRTIHTRRRRQLDPYSRCPCRSGKTAKFCCRP